ncbi:hypothetical protein MTR67_030615, partial [Solanum verrucosum]
AFLRTIFVAILVLTLQFGYYISSGIKKRALCNLTIFGISSDLCGMGSHHLLVSVCPFLVHPVSLPYWCLHCNVDIRRHWQGNFAVLSGISNDLTYVEWVSQLTL